MVYDLHISQVTVAAVNLEKDGLARIGELVVQVHVKPLTVSRGIPQFLWPGRGASWRNSSKK